MEISLIWRVPPVFSGQNRRVDLMVASGPAHHAIRVVSSRFRGSCEMTLKRRLSTSVDGIPAWQFAIRLLSLAVQLIAVVCLGQKGVLFFYQAF
jgi:hypothetical protein